MTSTTDERSNLELDIANLRNVKMYSNNSNLGIVFGVEEDKETFLLHSCYHVSMQPGEGGLAQVQSRTRTRARIEIMIASLGS